MDIITESYRFPPDFSKRIKSLRQKFGLPQQQFANLIDISLSLLKQ